MRRSALHPLGLSEGQTKGPALRGAGYGVPGAAKNTGAPARLRGSPHPVFVGNSEAEAPHQFYDTARHAADLPTSTHNRGDFAAGAGVYLLNESTEFAAAGNNAADKNAAG